MESPFLAYLVPSGQRFEDALGFLELFCRSMWEISRNGGDPNGIDLLTWAEQRTWSSVIGDLVRGLAAQSISYWKSDETWPSATLLHKFDSKDSDPQAQVLYFPWSWFKGRTKDARLGIRPGMLKDSKRTETWRQRKSTVPDKLMQELEALQRTIGDQKVKTTFARRRHPQVSEPLNRTDGQNQAQAPGQLPVEQAVPAFSSSALDGLHDTRSELSLMARAPGQLPVEQAVPAFSSSAPDGGHITRSELSLMARAFGLLPVEQAVPADSRSALDGGHIITSKLSLLAREGAGGSNSGGGICGVAEPGRAPPNATPLSSSQPLASSMERLSMAERPSAVLLVSYQKPILAEGTAAIYVSGPFKLQELPADRNVLLRNRRIAHTLMVLFGCEAKQLTVSIQTDLIALVSPGLRSNVAEQVSARVLQRVLSDNSRSCEVLLRFGTRQLRVESTGVLKHDMEDLRKVQVSRVALAGHVMEWSFSSPLPSPTYFMLLPDSPSGPAGRIITARISPDEMSATTIFPPEALGRQRLCIQMDGPAVLPLTVELQIPDTLAANLGREVWDEAPPSISDIRQSGKGKDRLLLKGRHLVGQVSGVAVVTDVKLNGELLPALQIGSTEGHDYLLLIVKRSRVARGQLCVQQPGGKAMVVTIPLNIPYDADLSEEERRAFESSTLRSSEDLGHSVRVDYDSICSAFAHVKVSQARRRMGDSDEAEHHLEVALTCEHDFEFALEEAVTARCKMAGRKKPRDYGEALQAIENLLKVRPNHPKALAWRGNIKLRERDLKGAKADLEEAIRQKRDAPYPFALRQLGALRLDMGDLEGAVAALDQALNLEGNNRFGLTERCHARLQMGAFDGALADAEKLLKLDPISESHFLRGLALANMGCLEKGASDLQEAIRLDAGHSLALRALGCVKRDLGDLHAAEENLVLALAADPDDDFTKAELAITKSLKCDKEGALAELIKLGPDNLWTLNVRSEVQWNIGNHQEAVRLLQLAMELDPADDRMRRTLWRVKLNLGMAEEARAEVDRFLKEHPNDVGALNDRVRMKLCSGDQQEAKADNDKALALKPKDVDALADRMFLRHLEADHSEALKTAEELIGLADPAYVVFNRGMIRAAMGQLEEAVADMQQAIGIRRNDPYILRELARTRGRMKNFRGALFVLDRALELNPYDSETYLLRAFMRRELGMAQEAIEDIEKVLHTNPDNPVALCELGAARLALGELAAAKAPLDRAFQLWPNDRSKSYVYFHRCRFRCQGGNLEEALADIEKALRLEPEEPDLFEQRSKVKEGMGNLVEAKDDLEKAIEMDPTEDSYKQELEAIERRIENAEHREDAEHQALAPPKADGARRSPAMAETARQDSRTKRLRGD